MRIRATRHLHPKAGVASTPLSDEERAQIATRRDCFKRKLKMARILAGEDLLDEARDASREAILFAVPCHRRGGSSTGALQPGRGTRLTTCCSLGRSPAADSRVSGESRR